MLISKNPKVTFWCFFLKIYKLIYRYAISFSRRTKNSHLRSWCDAHIHRALFVNCQNCVRSGRWCCFDVFLHLAEFRRRTLQVESECQLAQWVLTSSVIGTYDNHRMMILRRVTALIVDFRQNWSRNHGDKMCWKQWTSEEKNVCKTKINFRLGVVDILTHFLADIVDNCMEYNMIGCFLRIVKITCVIQEVILSKSQWRKKVNVSYRNEYETYQNSECAKRCAVRFYIGWHYYIVLLLAAAKSNYFDFNVFLLISNITYK
jgi:hypothetical protein